MNKRISAIVLAVILVIGAAGCSLQKDDPAGDIPAAVDDTFVIGWVSDPQWYSFKYFDCLTSQNDWIVENYEALDMRYVVHTGDFVDNPHTIAQWESVSPEYEKWDQVGLPYGVLAGNHDVDGTDYTEFYQYFGASRYADNPWYGESYDDNRGHYDRLTMGGVDFIFVYLGYGNHTAEDIAWLNRVLSENSDCIAMLAFHDYLVESGERSSAGDNIFRNVVLQNPNVRMVFCGHNYNATRRVDEIDDNGDGVADRTVYQMMANYQNLAEGGSGFFRLMECNVSEGTITSRTYSPYLDEYNAYPNSEALRDEYGYQDEFTIPFDFSVPTPKAEGDPAVGTVVINSRLVFAATDSAAALSVPVAGVNTAVENAAVFDRNFSLTATDAADDPSTLNYVVLRYTMLDGYRVERVIRGETLAKGALVPIPQSGLVIALEKNAVDSSGVAVDIDALTADRVVTFTQVNGRAAPDVTTFRITLATPWGETYGIHGTNRKVLANQWILLDAAVGENATATGDTHEWNMLFAFEPTQTPGEYVIAARATASGAVKDLPIPANGFVLAINTASGESSLRDSMETWFAVGTTVTLDGHTPQAE